MLLVFIVIYVYHVHPEIAQNNKSIWLLGLIAILALLADRFQTSAFHGVSEIFNIPPRLLFLMLPLGFSSVVISVIYGLRSAIFVALFVSGIAAVGLNNSFSTLLTGLFVSGIAGFAVRYSSDYKKFFAYSFLSCWIST